MSRKVGGQKRRKRQIFNPRARRKSKALDRDRSGAAAYRCRCLADMSPAEVAAIEELYGAKVVRPIKRYLVLPAS